MSAPFPSPTTKWHDNTYPSLSPTRSEVSVKGKSILITGGGTGIGAATADHFAQAGAARIALLGRRLQPLQDTKKALEAKFPHLEVFIASTDVTQTDQVNAAFAGFLGAADSSEKKILDIVVSNAAFSGATDSLASIGVDAFLESVDVNLRGALNVAKAFLHYKPSQSGVAINVSSAAAHVAFGDKFVAYSVAKFAVVRMWDALAAAHPDLDLFHVHPGVVDTEMNRQAGGIAMVGFEDHVSLPASFIVWLASTEARFLRGKFVWTNWDIDELKAEQDAISSSTKFNVGLVGWPFGDVK